MALSHSACGPSNPDSHAAGNGGNEDADISSLLGMLASVTDPRSPQGIQHALQFILAVCVVAICQREELPGNHRPGGRHASAPAEKARREMELVQAQLQAPERVNNKERADEDRRGRTGPHNRRMAFRAGQEYGKTEWEIAVDGKVMRGAWTDENDKVTLFSAMLHREAVTVAQVRVPDGTNEITQAGTLLDAVKIPEGGSALITLDAAHTQRETAEYVGGKPGWDFLMTVKGNQPSLHREVFDKILPLLTEAPHHVTEEHDRGRIKRRSCWITGAEGIDFPHARQAAFIRREIFEISGDRISKEHALILTSRKTEMMTAAELNRHARGHWGIENKSHYIRDTVYREDDSQAWAESGPHALASLRNLTLGLFRLKNASSIKETTEWVCRERTRALQFMTT